MQALKVALKIRKLESALERALAEKSQATAARGELAAARALGEPMKNTDMEKVNQAIGQADADAEGLGVALERLRGDLAAASSRDLVALRRGLQEREDAVAANCTAACTVAASLLVQACREITAAYPGIRYKVNATPSGQPLKAFLAEMPGAALDRLGDCLTGVSHVLRDPFREALLAAGGLGAASPEFDKARQDLEAAQAAIPPDPDAEQLRKAGGDKDVALAGVIAERALAEARSAKS